MFEKLQIFLLYPFKEENEWLPFCHKLLIWQQYTSKRRPLMNLNLSPFSLDWGKTMVGKELQCSADLSSQIRRSLNQRLSAGTPVVPAVRLINSWPLPGGKFLNLKTTKKSLLTKMDAYGQMLQQVYHSADSWRW